MSYILNASPGFVGTAYCDKPDMPVHIYMSAMLKQAQPVPLKLLL
jgi:hypothetical protein